MADNDLNVNYEDVLADLRAKREKIDAAISGIEIMVGIAGNPSPSVAKPLVENLPQAVEPDTFFKMSVPDATRKFLQMRKRPQATQDIANALEQGGVFHSSKDFPNTVGTVLTRIDKSGGDIIKIGRAKFGLAEWYPAAKRKKAAVKAETQIEDEYDGPDPDLAHDAQAEDDIPW